MVDQPNLSNQNKGGLNQGNITPPRNSNSPKPGSSQNPGNTPGINPLKPGSPNPLDNKNQANINKDSQGAPQNLPVSNSAPGPSSSNSPSPSPSPSPSVGGGSLNQKPLQDSRPSSDSNSALNTSASGMTGSFSQDPAAATQPPSEQGGAVMSSGIQEVDLKDKKIPVDVLKTFSKESSLKYKMIAFDLDGDRLKVAMVNPNNTNALNAMRFLASQKNLKTQVYKISKQNFDKAMENYGQATADIDKLVSDYVKSEEEIQAEREAKKKKAKIDTQSSGAAPVEKVVNVILDHAIKGQASDIHIEPQEESLRVRYRVDGDLHESFKMAKEIASAVVSRIKIMSNLRIDEKRKPQDGRLKITADDGRQIDVRVSIMPTSEGEKVVMRLLEKGEGLTELTNLGLEGRNLDVLIEAINQPFGIILVTGPTGSGKSTTIFASLRRLNEVKRNILTLEDPVEYKVPGVNHTQVNPEIGFTFANGLRSALRQDPDIIMVGEIRDGETAELATHAALTGHLVLSTLHTNDALGAIPRLVDMGIEAFLVSSSLRAVVGQRLVRRLCEDCKYQVEPTQRVKEYVAESLKEISPEEIKRRLPDFDPNNYKVWQAKGCSKCRDSGTKGRIGIYEVAECGKEMRVVIDDKLTSSNLEAEFKRQGAYFMKDDGVLKALAGYTTIEFVEEATAEDDQEELDQAAKAPTLQEVKKKKKKQQAQKDSKQNITVPASQPKENPQAQSKKPDSP
ncbi:MAG: hypothetical protein GF335_01125 [Candidatus Moranbacteria bacterium]|nr:hypothetical protein [Candidatus Moranbacteria bacterium]